MNADDPIQLLFGGMEKLGPGSNAHTRRVLRLLPKTEFHNVVDAGCGTGRQTLVLARELRTPIHAVDLYQPFLNDLVRRAKEAGLENLVHPHCMDMKDIPATFRDIDLLWSEGAAYNIGFGDALTVWSSAMTPDGLAAISELSWLRDQVPASVKEFFASGYPSMRSVQQNIAMAASAGYKVLDTHMLPRETWVEGYYDILEPRAKALCDHPDPSVREFAVDTLREIEVFECSKDSYGYVFYVLQWA
jgi:cyclopropane fatty-acyl-phospholipid synthase-like methyltransferase